MIPPSPTLSPTTPADTPHHERGMWSASTADSKGKQLGENAKVWIVYNEEAQKYDNDLIERWRSTVDILLVFAGLFSAVITTFAVGSADTFKPDYEMVTVSLLAELVNSNRNANGVSPIPMEAPFFSAPPFVSGVTRIDVLVYGLWYTSLTISLLVSLASVLVRQWLASYMSPTSASPATTAKIRQFRHQGLMDWGIPFIIGLLPFLLILSLFLFLAGLTMYLLSADKSIAIVVGALSVLAFVLYVISAGLPAFFTACPYRTSLSAAVYRLRAVLTGAKQRDFKHKEHDVVKSTRHLKKDSLFWLFDHTHSPKVHLAIVEALAGLYKEAKKGGGCSYASTLKRPLRTGRMFAFGLMSFIEDWWASLPVDNNDDFLACLGKGKIKRVAKAAAYLIHFDQPDAEPKSPVEPPSPCSWSSETLENPVGFRGFWLDHLLPTFRLWIAKHRAQNPDSTVADELDPVLEKVKQFVDESQLEKRCSTPHGGGHSLCDHHARGAGRLHWIRSKAPSIWCFSSATTPIEREVPRIIIDAPSVPPQRPRVNTQFSDSVGSRPSTVAYMPTLDKYYAPLTPNIPGPQTPVSPFTDNTPRSNESDTPIEAGADKLHVPTQSPPPVHRPPFLSREINNSSNRFHVPSHANDDEEKNTSTS